MTDLSGLGVLELEVLVSELFAVDRLAASTITTGEITTLEHEALYKTNRKCDQNYSYKCK